VRRRREEAGGESTEKWGGIQGGQRIRKGLEEIVEEIERGRKDRE
jgi:hypothetical protein